MIIQTIPCKELIGLEARNDNRNTIFSREGPGGIRGVMKAYGELLFHCFQKRKQTKGESILDAKTE
jgi:hypothetical protein